MSLSVNPTSAFQIPSHRGLCSGRDGMVGLISRIMFEMILHVYIARLVCSSMVMSLFSSCSDFSL
jgi:hypothetical protein